MTIIEAGEDGGGLSRAKNRQRIRASAGVGGFKPPVSHLFQFAPLRATCLAAEFFQQMFQFTPLRATVRNGERLRRLTVYHFAAALVNKVRTACAVVPPIALMRAASEA